MAYDATSFEISTETIVDPIKEVLKQARDLIDKQGWCRGTFKKPTRAGSYNFCMLGAVMHVTAYGNNHIIDIHLYDGAEARLIKCIPAPYNNKPIPFYNDEVASSVEDVLAIFDRAIAQ